MLLIRIGFMRPIESSTLCLALMLVVSVVGHGSTRMETDVLHYAATIEPDIAAKAVKGTVRIRFVTDSTEAEFNCGDLTVDSVRLAGAEL